MLRSARGKRGSRSVELPHGGLRGPAQPSPPIGDALNAGFRYLEIKCAGCLMHSTVGMAGAVYCGMLVALVDRDQPGGWRNLQDVDFTKATTSTGAGDGKAAGKKGDGRRAKRLHREVRPRAVGRRTTDLRSGLRHADPVHRREN